MVTDELWINPCASYALQAKISIFFFKKSINCLLSFDGSWVLTWEYLFLSSSMRTFSNPSHETEQSEETSNSGCDYYKTDLISNELTSDTWWLTIATIHYMAIAWHPTSSATPSSVGYFNFTCKVEDTAPITCSHGLTRMVVYRDKASTTIKSSLTILSHVYTGSWIIPFEIVVFPLNPIRGTSYLLRSSDLSPGPLNRSVYMISAPLP